MTPDPDPSIPAISAPIILLADSFESGETRTSLFGEFDR